MKTLIHALVIASAIVALSDGATAQFGGPDSGDGSSAPEIVQIPANGVPVAFDDVLRLASNTGVALEMIDKILEDSAAPDPMGFGNELSEALRIATFPVFEDGVYQGKLVLMLRNDSVEMATFETMSVQTDGGMSWVADIVSAHLLSNTFTAQLDVAPDGTVTKQPPVINGPLPETPTGVGLPACVFSCITRFFDGLPAEVIALSLGFRVEVNITSTTFASTGTLWLLFKCDPSPCTQTETDAVEMGLDTLFNCIVTAVANC